jgi:small GTP-binding protein
MPTIEERIKELEEEISRTEYNKATQHHIGRLKARIAFLKEQLEKRKGSKGGGKGYAVKKSGNATVGLVGFPSVGKSTLLNKITDAESEVGAYHFTTLDIVPGVMEYKSAKIQILDMPGIIRGASRGKGRGKEVISVARSVDLILLIIDVFETNIDVLVNELESAGIRLNKRPADITLTKTDRGGIVINTTVELTKMDISLAEDILKEYGIVNGVLVIREDITEDDLIDFLAGNRVYTKAIAVLNKIDLVTPEYVENLKRRLKNWEIVPISAEKEIGLDDLKEAIYRNLELINIYLKPQGGKADLNEPLVVKKGSTVEMVCNSLHRDFVEKFRYARVWGKSAKFDGQQVGLNHVLEDGDILTIVVRR